MIAICFLQINHPFDKKYSWHFKTNTQAKLTLYLQLQKAASSTQAVPTHGAPIKNMFSSTYQGYRWLSNKQFAEYSDKLIGKNMKIFKVIINILWTFSFRWARWDFEEAVLHRREEDQLPGGD